MMIACNKYLAVFKKLPSIPFKMPQLFLIKKWVDIYLIASFLILPLTLFVVIVWVVTYGLQSSGFQGNANSNSRRNAYLHCYGLGLRTEMLCLKNIGVDICGSRGDNRIGVDMSGSIYHERQVKELCALHALNNLFQEYESFSKSELDEICHSLSPNVWINPHKSLLGLGNYDINVIMAALQLKGCEALWFDKRKDPKCLNLQNVFGFILNVPSDYKFGFVLLPLRRRHWVTLREIQGSYYNLDSKLESPQLIGGATDVIDYLREQLEFKDKELFVIVTQEVERSQSWQLADATATPKSHPPRLQVHLEARSNGSAGNSDAALLGKDHR